MIYAGMEVWVDDRLGMVTKEAPRTWRERLFSFPWRPWQAKKFFVDIEAAYFMDTFNRRIYTNPMGIEALRRCTQHMQTLEGHFNG